MNLSPAQNSLHHADASRRHATRRNTVRNHAVDPDVLELAMALKQEQKHRDAAEAEIARLQAQLERTDGFGA